MAFSKIELRNFRCFDSLTIDLSSKSNLFFGKNGSGKTSILESVYVASSGRSFRTANLESLIRKGSKAFYIKAFDNTNGSILEVKKGKKLPINIKINNTKVTTSELVRAFPSFSIDSKTFFYNENAPEYRRKQIDRGLFVASPEYAKDWFGYFRALKQRNSALKLRDLSQAKAYDPILVEHGNRINILRQELVTSVKEIYDEVVNKLVSFNSRAKIFSGLKIYLKPGFDPAIGLNIELNKSNNIDLKRRVTTVGPHKSDVLFESEGLLIKDLFSRGEQKLLSILWSISQNIYLERSFNLTPILLLDDLSSELDSEMLECFLPTLEHIENRLIFSNIIDPFDSKITHSKQSLKKFHVEHLK